MGIILSNNNSCYFWSLVQLLVIKYPVLEVQRKQGVKCSFMHTFHIIKVHSKINVRASKLTTIENLKQCLYLKCSYLKMGSHGNALAVIFFRRRALALTRTWFSLQCGELGRFVSFNEIHALNRELDSF